MPDPLQTAHLALPYLAPAQAQKHVTHNEALRRLDAAVQLAVLDATVAEPPEEPEDGDRYIVAADATGVWEGHDGEIAAFVDGAWEFLAPEHGWLAYDRATEAILVRQAGGWEALSDLPGMIERLGVNTTAEDSNRLAVRSNAVLFTGVGAGDGGTGDVRFIVNKEADGDTASLLFQSGFSGRAEVGLAGDTDFVFKVSPDGTDWIEAIRIDKDTGRIALLYDNAVSGLDAESVQDAIDEIAAEQVPATRTVNGHALSGDVTVTKGDVGLGNADNTSDVNKPVSTATQTALDLKAPLASPALTGNPTAPTQSQADDSTRVATTAYVRAAIGAVLDGVSASFDTLAEIATALAARVVGPASVTDSHVAQFDGTTGKLVKGGKAAPGGAFVGTSDTQTLTNKTLTAPAISSPTGLIKADVGLGNVDNTSDVNKPVSTATQTALDLKAPLASPTFTGAVTLPNATVSLAQMANMATASLLYRKTAGSGAPEVNSLATLKTDLGLSGTNSGDQTVTLTGDVTGSGTGSFAATIANGAVTLAKMANMATASLIYRRTGGSGAPEVNSLAQLKTDLALAKGDVGLGNADNTSDANKPVSTATQTALDLKAPLASPALTGTPTAPTQSQADDSTKVATTAYVRAAIAAVLNGVSASFDTLAEIATALGGKLTASSNLSDVGSAATARTNLGVGMALLASGTVSSAATLDVVLTSYTAYRGIFVQLTNFAPATDNVGLLLRTSTNGGSSYDAGGSNYWWNRLRIRGGSAFNDNTTASTSIEIVPEVGNDAGRAVSARFWLWGQTATSVHMKVRYEAEHFDAADDQVFIAGFGRRLATDDVDAVRVLFSSGNIASGGYAIYGVL